MLEDAPTLFSSTALVWGFVLIQSNVGLGLKFSVAMVTLSIPEASYFTVILLVQVWASLPESTSQCPHPKGESVTCSKSQLYSSYFHSVFVTSVVGSSGARALSDILIKCQLQWPLQICGTWLSQMPLSVQQKGTESITL